MLTRRIFLAATGLTLAAGGRAESVRQAAVPPSLDHLILAVRDLDEGMAWVAQKTGVHASPGGVHPGRGTRNALLSLGPRRYVEIMAPDPAQPANADARELRALPRPTVIGWASHLADMTGMATRLRAAGIAFDGPTPGSRRRPDGRLLQWQTINLNDDLGGVLPFFIEWGPDSPHPSEDAPAGLTLARFAAGTPRTTAAAGAAQSIDLGLQVEPAPAVRLQATVRAGAREVTL